MSTTIITNCSTAATTVANGSQYNSIKTVIISHI